MEIYLIIVTPITEKKELFRYLSFPQSAKSTCFWGTFSGGMFSLCCKVFVCLEMEKYHGIPTHISGHLSDALYVMTKQDIEVSGCRSVGCRGVEVSGRRGGGVSRCRGVEVSILVPSLLNSAPQTTG